MEATSIFTEIKTERSIGSTDITPNQSQTEDVATLVITMSCFQLASIESVKDDLSEELKANQVYSDESPVDVCWF